MARVQETEPLHAAAPLEADDNYTDDADSTYSPGSETTSVKESIYKFRCENGRTYHSYASDCDFPLMPAKSPMSLQNPPSN